MLPYSEINVGDMFSDPMSRGFGEYSGLTWVVEEKKEKMIKLQAHRASDGSVFGPPIWKKNTARMFSEHWRV